MEFFFFLHDLVSTNGRFRPSICETRSRFQQECLTVSSRRQQHRAIRRPRQSPDSGRELDWLALLPLDRAVRISVGRVLGLLAQGAAHDDGLVLAAGREGEPAGRRVGAEGHVADPVAVGGGDGRQERPVASKVVVEVRGGRAGDEDPEADDGVASARGEEGAVGALLLLLVVGDDGGISGEGHGERAGRVRGRGALGRKIDAVGLPRAADAGGDYNFAIGSRGGDGGAGAGVLLLVLRRGGRGGPRDGVDGAGVRCADHVGRAPLRLGLLPDDDLAVEGARRDRGAELGRRPRDHPHGGGVTDEGRDELVVGGAEDSNGFVGRARGEVTTVVVELSIVDDVAVLGFDELLLGLIFRRHFLFFFLIIIKF